MFVHVNVCVQLLLEAVQHYLFWSKQSLIILLSGPLTVKLLSIQRMSSHWQFLGIVVHFNVANCRRIMEMVSRSMTFNLPFRERMGDIKDTVSSTE